LSRRKIELAGRRGRVNELFRLLRDGCPDIFKVFAPNGQLQDRQIVIELGAAIHSQNEVRASIVPHHRLAVRRDAEHFIEIDNFGDILIPGDNNRPRRYKNRPLRA
jgi:hypothetical protein